MNLQCQNNSFTLFGLFDYLMTPLEMNRITTSFSDYSPSFVNEMTPNGPASVMRLEHREKGLVILLRNNSVVITKTLVPAAQIFDDSLVKDFCDTIKQLLPCLFKEAFTGNRIALRTQCFVFDHDNNCAKRVIPSFCKDSPLDFHLNMNDPIQLEDPTFKEKVNRILFMDSAKANLPSEGENKVIDAISIRTDINTVPERIDHRFSSSNIETGLNHLREQNQSVLNDLMVLLDEEK